MRHKKQTPCLAGPGGSLFSVLLAMAVVFVFRVDARSEVPLILSRQLQTDSLQLANPEVLPAGKDVPKTSDSRLFGSKDVSETSDSDLFGTSGGYFHPYIGVGFEYTDNLYNVNGNLPVDVIIQPNGDTVLLPASDNPDGTKLGQVSNLLTTITPGIWFSLPSSKQAPIHFAANNTTPGGLRFQLDDAKGTDTYQAFALAELNFNTYSDDTTLDDTTGKAEGFFRYNMSNGLSLQLLDGLTVGEDQLEIGALYRNDMRRFTSNLFVATADYAITEKTRVKLEYSTFMLHYDDDINDLFNRTDSTLDLYGYYKYSVKTAVFLQWSMIDVVYKTAEEKNNQQYYMYGGIEWKATEKLALTGKVGTQTRTYAEDVVAGSYDSSNVTYEINALYQRTFKTYLDLSFYGRSEESNSALAFDMNVWGARFGYNQQLTEKLFGAITGTYENTQYNQIIEKERNERRYIIRPSLRYEFRDWATVELAYNYDKRDSSDNLFDYTTNTVILNFNFSL